MLEPEDNDTLSGNESGIELEETGVEQDEAVELRPTGKARNSRYRNTLVSVSYTHLTLPTIYSV